jgi:hypothetical protein
VGGTSSSILVVTSLLPLLESVSLLATMPVMAKSFASEGSTISVMKTTTSAAPAIAPNQQETVPPDISHVPWPGWADTALTPGGSVSVSNTAVASEGPELVTVSS